MKKQKLENIQQEYYFYTISHDYLNLTKYDIFLISEKNNKKIECTIKKEEKYIYLISNKSIFFFKFVSYPNTSIIIKNEMKKIDIPIKLSKSSFLGYINICNDEYDLNDEINIICTHLLLKSFECKEDFLKPLIDKYKFSYNERKKSIYFKEFIYLFKILNNYDKLNLLLDNIKFDDIFFGEKNIEKNIYEEESNLLESNLKFNKREELIDIYIFILYKFDKNKFNKTLNDGEIYQKFRNKII